jgi:hypothetical protein
MNEGGGVSASPFDEPYDGSHPPADGRNDHRRLGLTYLGPPSREREEEMRRDWQCAVRVNPLSLPRETPRSREDDNSLMGATVHVNVQFSLVVTALVNIGLGCFVNIQPSHVPEVDSQLRLGSFSPHRERLACSNCWNPDPGVGMRASSNHSVELMSCSCDANRDTVA